MPKEVPKVSADSAVVGAPSIAINGALMPRDTLDSKNKYMYKKNRKNHMFFKTTFRLTTSKQKTRYHQ